MAERRYTGPVVFSEGVHWPATKDGHPDKRSNGLRVTEDGGWRYAEADEPLHNDTNHLRDLEVEVGGES